MKVKRISAPDMRQAIRKVRDQFGPEAVILSTKPTDEGVEVFIALDASAETLKAQSTTRTFQVEPSLGENRSPLSPLNPLRRASSESFNASMRRERAFPKRPQTPRSGQSLVPRSSSRHQPTGRPLRSLEKRSP